MPRTTKLIADLLRVGLPFALLAAGVAGFLTLAGRRPAKTRPEEPPTATLVETVSVAGHPGGIDFELDGVVVPFRQIVVAAEVGGRVTFKSPECDAGRYVAAGTKLVEIDRRQYALEVTRLEKELEQALVSIEELDVERQSTEGLVAVAEEDLGIQEQQLARIEGLVARGAATDAQFDDEKRAVLAARNAFLSLQKELRMLGTRRLSLERGRELAEARLDQAKLDLSRTEVSAPIDGVIVSDDVEEDGFVQPGSGLFVMEDVSAMEVRCNLRMEELAWILQQPARDGQLAGGEGRSAEAEEGGGNGGGGVNGHAVNAGSVNGHAVDDGAVDDGADGDGDAEVIAVAVESDYRLPPTPATIVYRLGEREFTWEGVLSRYDGLGVDEQTRTVPCRITVEEPRSTVRGDSGGARGPRSLLRGMFVKVIVHAVSEGELLSIPEQAIRPGNRVWLIEDGELAIRKAQVVRLMGEQVLVEPGTISEGDRVVTSPIAAVTEGMELREQVTE